MAHTYERYFLTFFFRQMPNLIASGHLYIAQPPLYQVKRGRNSQYLQNDEEMEDYLLTLALDTVQIINSRRDAPYTISEYRAISTAVRRVQMLLDQIQRTGNLTPSQLFGTAQTSEATENETNGSDSYDNVDQLLNMLENSVSHENDTETLEADEPREESPSAAGIQATLFGNPSESAETERFGSHTARFAVLVSGTTAGTSETRRV